MAYHTVPGAVYLIEVNRAKQTVWEFHIWDNLVQNFDPTKANYGNPVDHQDKWDVNWINPGMPVPGSATVASTTQDWTHFNTINYHPTDNNKIVTNSRHMGESYIIDKAAKKLIYRFGNPSVYGAGKAPSFQNDGDTLMWGPHHAHIIPPGLPGAGHMLIIDNGWNRPEGNRTRSIEVDMSQTSNTAKASTATGALPTGNTAIPGTMHPGHIIWQYGGARPNSMYSASQCSNQRLPNGNTFITITETGHIIEVTKGVASGVNWVNKEVVWEFINPLYSTGSVAAGYTYPVVSCLGTDGGTGGTATTLNPTSIHRSTLIPADHPGLRGKDLSRKYLLATGCPEFWKMLPYPTTTTPAFMTQWNALQAPEAAPLTGWGFGSFGTSVTTTTGTGISGGGGGAGGGGGGGGGGY